MSTVLRLLDPQPGDIVLDGTVGLGGHALAIVPRILPGGRYIGIDVDATMLEEARPRLTAFGDAVSLYAANYADFPEVLSAAGVARVNVALLDLGVNSAQLDDPARGFSFEREGPLDMRFDATQKTQALDLVNRLDEKSLADLFFEFGQEGLSRKIARRICQVRHSGRITTTAALAGAVESAVVASGGSPGKIHPATRVFQALRVAVNRELDNLRRFLDQICNYLAPGGRLGVLSFHSLEDAIVKNFVKERKAAGELEDLTRRPEIADPQERGRNPRSRSAKFRAARRVGQE